MGNQQYGGHRPNNMGMMPNQKRTSDTLAVVSLIIGIISIIGACCMGGFLGIIGATLGIVAIVDRYCNKKAQAIMGIVFSVLAFILTVVVLMIGSTGDKNETSEEISAKIENEQSYNTIEPTNEDALAVPNNNTISVTTKPAVEKEVMYEIVDTQFYTFVNSIGSGEYFFIMEIENTGSCDLYLAECKVDLEDSNGHLLQTGDTMSNCPSIIKPGEKGYFYNGTLEMLIDDNVNVRDVATAVPHIEIEAANGEAIEYPISDLSIAEENGYAKVVGRVTNNTSEDDSGVYINVIFYNCDGKVIGITGTNVYDIKAGETKGFDCSSMFMAGELNYSDIADYKIIAQKDYLQW